MEQIKDIYEKKFNNEWKPGKSVGQYDYGWLYLQHYLKYKATKILDVGCGTGQYSNELLVNGFTNIYAVDLFEQPPLKAEGFHYTQAEIEALPYKEASFDFIFAQSVIHYAEDPEKAVCELNRVLKDGGIVYLSGHTRYSIYTLTRRIKRALKFESAKHLQGLKFLPASYYKKLLEKHDFSIIKTDGWGMCFFDFVFRCIYALAKIFHIKYADPRKRIDTCSLWRRFKSVVGYHFVIIAQKKAEEKP